MRVRNKELRARRNRKAKRVKELIKEAIAAKKAGATKKAPKATAVEAKPKKTAAPKAAPKKKKEEAAPEAAE
ncbi:MAG: hypothetical protein Fur0036_01950 [Fimbriimonadaceae bacterium]